MSDALEGLFAALEQQPINQQWQEHHQAASSFDAHLRGIVVCAGDGER